MDNAQHTDEQQFRKLIQELIPFTRDNRIAYYYTLPQTNLLIFWVIIDRNHNLLFNFFFLLVQNKLVSSLDVMQWKTNGRLMQKVSMIVQV